MNVKFFKRAVKCLDATIGIVSNNKELIRDKRFFSISQNGVAPDQHS
jgi:hypothetical protein